MVLMPVSLTSNPAIQRQFGGPSPGVSTIDTKLRHIGGQASPDRMPRSSVLPRPPQRCRGEFPEMFFDTLGWQTQARSKVFSSPTSSLFRCLSRLEPRSVITLDTAPRRPCRCSLIRKETTRNSMSSFGAVSLRMRSLYSSVGWTASGGLREFG